MKALSLLWPLRLVLFAIGVLLPAELFAKGEAVGFWMEGKVAKVEAKGESIQFQLTGRFWLLQYPDGAEPRQRIEVDCKEGASVVVRQGDPFFAFSSDWGAGALRPKGTLLKILKAAEEKGRVVKFELTEASMAFGGKGPQQTFALSDGVVIRATDADLR